MDRLGGYIPLVKKPSGKKFLLFKILVVVGILAISISSFAHESAKPRARRSAVPKAKDPCENTAPAHLLLAQNGTGIRVLVTGGAGFIGSNLVDRLLELGYQIRVFDNLATGSLRNVPLDNPNVEFVLGDITNYTQVHSATAGVAYVYHLAAMSKVVPSLKSPTMARFCTEVNALGTWNVLESARKHAVKKVVYAGSSTYYGNQPVPHKETGPPDFLTPYAASKYEGEMQMQMFNMLFNVSTVTLRFFMVYGPRQPSTGAYAIVTGVFGRQAAEGKALTIEGDGDHARDFVHVLDIVEGLILAQQKDEVKGTVINLGTGKSFSVKQVADLVSPKQVKVAPRKNDLNETLADTCRMKTVLNYEPQRDFLKEMSTIVKATIAGEVWSQSWLNASRIKQAPWIVPAGSAALPWSRKQNDLGGLLQAVAEGSAKQPDVLSLIPFDAVRSRYLLLNHIYSLTAFGEAKSYIVAATNPDALKACLALSLPCWNATSADGAKSHESSLVLELIQRNITTHVSDVNASYVKSVSATAQTYDGADVVLFRTNKKADGPTSYVVRANEKTKALFKQLAGLDKAAFARAFAAKSGQAWVEFDRVSKVQSTKVASVATIDQPTTCVSAPIDPNTLFLSVCPSYGADGLSFEVGNSQAWNFPIFEGDLLAHDVQQFVPKSWLSGGIDKVHL